MIKKNRCFILLTALLLITSWSVIPAAAETEIEQFLLNFDGEYGKSNGLQDPFWISVFDSHNPYVKEIKKLVTSENGVTVMLDKVLVTEDDLSVSFLISAEQLPENLNDVQLQLTTISVGPILPYPEDSFEPIGRGGGGGGPLLQLANQDPPVYYQFVSTPLLFFDGYVSAADPVQVKVSVPTVAFGWRNPESDQEYENSDYFYDEINATFEFETDGAELAALTRNLDLYHAFEISEHNYSFDKLRFNPMFLILFATDEVGPMNTDPASVEAIKFVNAVTDDGTVIRLLDSGISPYYGFTRKILDEGMIEALKETETLTLIPCTYKKPLAEYETYPWENDDDYLCHQDLAVTVTID